jgi:hypothetical protein
MPHTKWKGSYGVSLIHYKQTEEIKSKNSTTMNYTPKKASTKSKQQIMPKHSEDGWENKIGLTSETLKSTTLFLRWPWITKYYNL